MNQRIGYWNPLNESCTTAGLFKPAAATGSV